jgi:hypothetical protein
MAVATARWFTRATYTLHIILIGLFAPIGISETEADERPTNAEDLLGTVHLVSYQDPGYEFFVIGQHARPPAGFESLEFQAAGFKQGTAAFGSGGSCPLQNTVNDATAWPINTQLLVRRELVVPPGATNIRIMVAVDNDIIAVFVNGQPLLGTPIKHEGCPILDEFRFDVPPSLILPSEKNVVAFHLRDRGLENFFDTQILAELSPDRLLENAAQELPTLPNRDRNRFEACLACSDMSKKGKKDCTPDPDEIQKNCPPPGGAAADQVNSCVIRNRGDFFGFQNCVEQEGEEADAARREKCDQFWGNIGGCLVKRAVEEFVCAMQTCLGSAQ